MLSKLSSTSLGELLELTFFQIFSRNYTKYITRAKILDGFQSCNIRFRQKNSQLTNPEKANHRRRKPTYWGKEWFRTMHWEGKYRKFFLFSTLYRLLDEQNCLIRYRQSFFSRLRFIFFQSFAGFLLLMTYSKDVFFVKLKTMKVINFFPFM